MSPAPTKGLSMAEMVGNWMPLTSVGHVGVTALTPVIDAPDVAVLGATATRLRATLGGDHLVVWRKSLPALAKFRWARHKGVDDAWFVGAIGGIFADGTLFERQVRPGRTKSDEKAD